MTNDNKIPRSGKKGTVKKMKECQIPTESDTPPNMSQYKGSTITPPRSGVKILLLTPIYYPQKGGAALAFHYLSHILASNKNVSEILILSNWKGTPDLFRSYSEKIKHLNLLKYGQYSDPLFITLWNTRIIRETIAAFQPDIIIFHSVIIPYREYYPEVFSNIGNAKLFLYKTDLFPVPSFPQLAGIVYLSQNIGNMLRQQQFPPSQLIHIPLLFKPPRSSLLKKIENQEPPIPGKYLLFVGSTDPIKGFYQLAKAFKLLKEKHTDLKLVIIGRDVDGASFDPGILFLDELDHTEVVRYIFHSAAVVIPSFSEGLPRVALETLYIKKPLIISSIVEETRHLGTLQVLETNEPGELAGKIAGILDGRPVVTQFPWEQLSFTRSKQAWNSLVDRIIETRTPPVSSSLHSQIDFHSFSNRLIEQFYPSIVEYYQTIKNSAALQNLPSSVSELFPRLDRISTLSLFEHVNSSNAIASIESIIHNPLLLSREKKELLKTYLTKLFDVSRFSVEPGRLKAYFDELVPLTAYDFVFMAEYVLRQSRLEDARDFFYLALNEGPESAHITIYDRLLQPCFDLFIQDRRSELQKAFQNARVQTCRFLAKKPKKTSLDFYRLASLYKQLNDYKNAVLMFRKVLRRNSDSSMKAGAWFHLGEIYRFKGEKEKSVECFSRCLEIDPNHRKAAEMKLI